MENLRNLLKITQMDTWIPRQGPGHMQSPRPGDARSVWHLGNILHPPPSPCPLHQDTVSRSEHSFPPTVVPHSGGDTGNDNSKDKPEPSGSREELLTRALGSLQARLPGRYSGRKDTHPSLSSSYQNQGSTTKPPTP